ncbi:MULTISPECIES: hypothetical protein [unclassified Streptomyces]|uniref:hypothetical protein n=1 Tax=unclassified Streptomyces TaxID=2593676 RepID=UPI002E2CE293|nr:hypothetical protein [Streptomyces sp. NBC_00223]
MRPTSGGYVPGVDGEGAAARRVFTPEELLPALLPSKAGGPGTIGQLGLGTGPGKGELMADCPSRAKDMVAELYRMTAPRVTQLTPVEEGDAAPGPAEQIVTMSRDLAARFVELKRAVAGACRQTTVTAVGSRSVPPQTLRFGQHKVRMGDDAFVQETTTWEGGADAVSAGASAGERSYSIVIRMGGVLLMYGDFRTEAAALAAGEKAAAHARPVLLRASSTPG